MRGICTGIAGAGRMEYLQEVAALARSRGQELPIFDLREAMFQIADDVGEPVEEESILDMFPRALVLLRAAALEKISKVVEQASRYPHWIIATHAVFRWKNTLIAGFDPYYLEQLRPDFFATITSGVLSVRQRLQGHTRWENLTVEDLLVWREEEQFSTEELARIHRKPQYLIGYQAPPETLYRLIFQPEMRRAYLSYPMTHGKTGEDRGLQQFKERLQEQVVVFDPMDVDDFCLEDVPESRAGTGNSAPPRVQNLSLAAEFSPRELQHITDQIVFRDYKLIAQSDMVVVYYDIPVPSPGVVSEMNYALHTGKRVYGVWLPPSEPSPFFTRCCTRVFSSSRSGADAVEQFFQFLAGVVGRRPGDEGQGGLVSTPVATNL